MAVLKTCVDRKFPLVVATTGHEPEQKAEIEAAAHQTAVLYSPNMSLVVNLLFKLTQMTGEKLARERVRRRDHRAAPPASRRTRRAAPPCSSPRSSSRRWARCTCVHGREGLVGERPVDEIGIHAVRAGDNVGEHTIIFSALGETLELVHKGHSRDSYARGALQAAKFLAGKPAGRYTMDDVLGL